MWTIGSRNLRIGTRLLLFALLTTGCFFGDALEIITFTDGSLVISFSTRGTWLPCAPADRDGVYECGYFGEDRISSISLSPSGLFLTLLIYDPLILQVPAEVADFRASYFAEGGGGGALDIRSGMTSIPVDSTRKLQAEPGMQLVIIDFPAGAPASGTGGFNLNFRVPDEMETLNIKALFTGKVTIEDETYYVPLYPCTSDMTALPSFSVPIPNGGLLELPVESVQGCDNEVYTFMPAQHTFDNTLLLPKLGK